MENNKVVRVTKAQRFEDLKALLEGTPVKYNTDIPAAIAFIDSEMALLAKKNSAKANKPSKKDQENENWKALILDYLSGQSEGRTCTEILKAIPEMEAEGYGNQKVAALIRPMVAAGLVEKSIVRGKALFTIA